jgi:hypothetical protein
MSRVNQPDTLLTELREIQRRLRLLEGGRPAAVSAAAAAVSGAPVMVPFVAARTEEWPGTTSADWTALVRVLTGPGAFHVVVESVADADTTGEVRVLVQEDVVDEQIAVTADLTRSSVSVTPEAASTEILVEARRTGGAGAVRVVAFLLPGT